VQLQGPVSVGQLVEGVSDACAAPVGRRELRRLRLLAEQEQRQRMDPAVLDGAECMGEALGDLVFFQRMDRRGAGRYEITLQ
jgi:hypothetical protein